MNCNHCNTRLRYNGGKSSYGNLFIYMKCMNPECPIREVNFVGNAKKGVNLKEIEDVEEVSDLYVIPPYKKVDPEIERVQKLAEERRIKLREGGVSINNIPVTGKKDAEEK